MTHQKSATDPSNISRLVEIAAGHREDWSDADVEAMFAHQLCVPLAQDLGIKPRESITTYGDLLRHPQPPIDLLRLTKAYGKIASSDSRNELPAAVANALYSLAIAVALVKCGERISELTDSNLREGFRWIESQKWIEEPLRQIGRAALDSLR